MRGAGRVVIPHATQGTEAVIKGARWKGGGEGGGDGGGGDGGGEGGGDGGGGVGGGGGVAGLKRPRISRSMLHNPWPLRCSGRSHPL